MKSRLPFIILLLLAVGIVWSMAKASLLEKYTVLENDGRTLHGALKINDIRSSKDVIIDEDLVAAKDTPNSITTSTSNQAFNKMMDVLTHARCINCHPSDYIPKQGDDRHPHYFGMARGKDGQGFQATNCATCHQSENNGYSGVPGAPHWALAPASMGWEGLTRHEIAEKMLNPATNGGKNHRELVEHMTQDELVLWAWRPGVDANGKQREVPPVSEKDFKAAVKQWFAEGAVIPAK